MTCLNCTPTFSNVKVIQKPYEGDCKHELNDIQEDTGYGFRAAWGCKGIGIYAQCPHCKACQYHLDNESCSEEEIEWYNESLFSKGWVKVSYEEIQTNPDHPLVEK